MKKFKCLSCGLSWFSVDAVFCPECGGRFLSDDLGTREESDVPNWAVFNDPGVCLAGWSV